MKGKLIVFDGIAGSGKSTILRETAAVLRADGVRVFDRLEWEKTHTDPPRFEEVSDFDAYFTYEPTRTWIGAAIRHELSRNDHHAYDGKTLAHVFAADRFVAYRRLIVPALEAGKIIFQDRSVSTSVVYQSISPSGYSVEELVNLPGNAFALRYPPTHLVITHLPPDEAAQRYGTRSEESRGVFADEAYLKRVQERFLSPWFRELFEQCGSEVHLLDTSGDLETMKQKAANFLARFLPHPRP